LRGTKGARPSRLLRPPGGAPLNSLSEVPDAAYPVPVVITKADRVVTNSRAVADYFGKRHDHVIRDIEKIAPDLGTSWITRTDWIDAYGRIQKSYDLTRSVLRRSPPLVPKANAPKNELITLHEIDGAPLVLDTDLAEALGFDRPRVIRELIERNREELEGYGSLAARHGKSRGQDFTAFYLNEEQALLICMLSRTPTAKTIRREVIAVYQAWRKGKLQPAAPAMPAIPQDFASALKMRPAKADQAVGIPDRITAPGSSCPMVMLPCLHPSPCCCEGRSGIRVNNHKPDQRLQGHLQPAGGPGGG